MRLHNIAAGALMWLQEPRFGFRIITMLFQMSFFALLSRFKFSLNFTVLWSRFYLGFFLLAAKLNFSEP